MPSYSARCILAIGHECECFTIAYFNQQCTGFYIIGNGKQWVDIAGWPIEVINLSWDVYEDIRDYNIDSARGR